MAQEFEEKINEKLWEGENEWKNFMKNLNPDLSFTQRFGKGTRITSRRGWEIKARYIKYLAKGIDAQPVTIKVRVPNGVYKIYLKGEFKKGLFTFRNSIFKSRIENDKDYKIFDFNNIINNNLILLGEYKITDGYFDISIDDLEKSPVFKLKKIIFEPVNGIKEHEDKERTEKLKALGYLN